MEGFACSQEQIEECIQLGIICPVCKSLFHHRNHANCACPESPEKVKELLSEGKTETALSLLIPPISFGDKMFGEPDQYCLGLRFDWINKFRSWALPAKYEQLIELKKLIGNRTVLEIGAGSGLWSALLKSVGINIIATEPYGGRYPDRQKTPIEYVQIDKLTGEQALEKYNQVGTLFICWGDSPISDLTQFNGDQIIIIGEGYNGCTCAGAAEVEDDENWELVATINIPKWSCMNDNLQVFVRK